MESFELIIILVSLVFVLLIGYAIGKYVARMQLKEKILGIREDAIKQSRAVLSGQFSEQIAPYLPNFPYNPTEARFIGKPIDFIVFKGIDTKKIDEVVFVEVKSGKSRVSEVEKTLKLAVESKKVSWYEYRVPEQLTEK